MVFTSVPGLARKIAFLDGGQQLVIGRDSSDGDTVAILAFPGSSEVATFNTHAMNAVNFGVAARQGLVAVSAPEAKINIVEAETGHTVDKIDTGLDDVRMLAPSPRGKRLAASDGAGRLAVWDLGPVRKTVEARSPDGPIESMAFSPDGSCVATVAGKKLYLFRFKRRSFESVQGVHLNSGATPLAFSNGGSHLVALNAGRIDVVDWKTGQVFESAGEGSGRAILGSGFLRDDTTLIFGGMDGLLEAWDIRAMKSHWRLDIRQRYRTAASTAPWISNAARLGRKPRRQDFRPRLFKPGVP